MKRIHFILCLLFSITFSCNKVLHVADVELEQYKIESTTTAPDSEITEIIAPYKKQLDADMNEVIGESAISMKKAKPQSTLGNWIADMIHKKSEDYYGQAIDFSIANYGGIRIPELRKGPITRRQIFELMPFENRLLLINIKGTIAQQLFDRMAEDGGWPISRQVRYEIKQNKPQNITINGEAIDPDKVYKIALPDFIANGGGECFFLKNQPREDLGKLFRDAMIEYIEEETAKGKIMDAEMDHRLKSVD